VIKALEEVHRRCVAEGYLQEAAETDFEMAKSLLEVAEQDLDTLNETLPIMERKGNFSLIWKSEYEIIRQLVQGILLLEKVRSENHQCLYAYLCTKHKEWGIGWETIETMRLLRNGVHYEGRAVSAEKWKEYKPKFNLYNQIFLRILKEKLAQPQS